MKHSIRFIRFQYSPSGKGRKIIVLRGMEVREYPYTDKNSHNLSLLTIDWPTQYYKQSIDINHY